MDIFKIISQGSIVLILSFYAILSIINFDIKFLIYLIFLLLTYGITFGVAFIRDKRKGSNYPYQDCNFGYLSENSPGLNFFPFLEPSLNSMFLSFNFMYTILPMIFVSSINYGAVAIFGLAYLINTIYSVYKQCNPIMGVLQGTMIGAIGGLIGYFILYLQDMESLMYFSEESTKKCKLNKNTFKCKIISKT